jgi:hypothetical protein
MTRFEQMLLDKGYLKYVINCKTMRYEVAKGHIISTIMNIDHRYIHKTDMIFLQKANNLSVMDESFTWEDRKGEICFGLHEAGKPPTLIFPRPRIEVKRIINGKEVIENEQLDNSINVVLNNIPHEEIFKAMWDKSICFKIDLTSDN